MMPKVAQLEAAFGRHGIGANSRVVLYSIGTPMWATRFWWMLKSLGFDNVFGARRRSRQMESGRPRHRERACEGIPAGDVHGETAVRIFCRQAGRARRQGRSEHRRRQCTRPAIPQGPGAQSVRPAGADSRQLQCVGGDAARSQDQGLRPARRGGGEICRARHRKDKRVVAYCGGGISATIDLFLLYRLGYDNLTLYDGSMGEWAKDASLPIETG